MRLLKGGAAMADDRGLDFEHLPGDGPLDETDVNLRAYFARLTDDRLAEYDPEWSDDRVMEWDGNFRADGALMLTCCERDVDVDEYRRVLERHIAYRRSLPAERVPH
jgi:hypothetical protein